MPPVELPLRPFVPLLLLELAYKIVLRWTFIIDFFTGFDISLLRQYLRAWFILRRFEGHINAVDEQKKDAKIRIRVFCIGLEFGLHLGPLVGMAIPVGKALGLISFETVRRTTMTMITLVKALTN